MPVPSCIDPAFGEFCSDSSANALAINFSNGFSTCASTATLFAVRAVRGGR